MKGPEILSTPLENYTLWFYKHFPQVVCQAGIFHGGKPLCETQKTRATVISKDGVAQWDQELRFPVKVHNLPRMSRICFGVYEISKTKSKRRGKDSNKVGNPWFLNRLRSFLHTRNLPSFHNLDNISCCYFMH